MCFHTSLNATFRFEIGKKVCPFLLLFLGFHWRAGARQNRLRFAEQDVSEEPVSPIMLVEFLF